MPLTIIKGPPNSGRTDEIESRYLSSLESRPVLVVPGVDDIFDWERRLTRGDRAVVGGQIVHFRDLYVEILRAAGDLRPARASELQRLGFVRQALKEKHPELARLIPDQPGLTRAVLGLIDDFQGEMLDPDTINQRAGEAQLRHLGPYSLVYRDYLDSLEGAGLTDAPGEARAAILKVHRAWQKRPVLFAGFDEMTGQQLEMVRRLAFVCEVDVAVAVSFEPDNPAMTLTATLVSQLEHLGPDDGIDQIDTSRPDDLPHAAVLLRLQRDFLRPGTRGTIDSGEDPGALTVLRSTGRRNEAEAIGGEIARLVAGGDEREPVEPGQIAVAVETPAQNGILIRDALAGYGIPVALEGETPAHATVTGKAVLELLAASRDGGTAQNLIALLRAPGGPAHDEVDRLELGCRLDDTRTASKAARLGLEKFGVSSPALERLAAGEDPTVVVSEAARSVAGAILAEDTSPVPGTPTVIEVRTAEAIATACDEIREIEGQPEHALAIAEAIQSGLVKVWAVPDQGTVRIASPYSLRAKRFEHLFFAGLQEAPLADTERIGPFLSAVDLSSLGMSPRRDPEEQQRYLFYSCLTVPTRGLCLSCRISDETGSPEHPSPLIEATEELFVIGADGPAIRRGGRLGSDSVFRPGAAPTATELARSLRGERVVETAIPGVEAEVAASIDLRLSAAKAAATRNRGLGDLTLETILGPWADQPVFGATELEAFSSCQYQWFIERQVNPQSFGPEPDYFAFGTLVHGVLERLYADDPGSMPRDGKVPEGWLEKIPALVLEMAGDRQVRLDTDSITHASARRMAELRVRLYLERQRHTNPYFLPALVEANFGTRHSELEAVDMGGWKLKGKIDRIDLSPDSGTLFPRSALVVDYKTGAVGAKYSPANAVKERKFQIQLYMEALRRLGDELGFGDLEPVAGMYAPVRLGEEPARGAALCEEKKLSKSDDPIAVDLISRGFADGDTVPDMSEFVATGRGLADAAVAGIASGVLDHDPATCPCHFESPAVRNIANAEEEEGWTR